MGSTDALVESYFATVAAAQQVFQEGTKDLNELTDHFERIARAAEEEGGKVALHVARVSRANIDLIEEGWRPSDIDEARE